MVRVEHLEQAGVKRGPLGLWERKVVPADVIAARKTACKDILDKCSLYERYGDPDALWGRLAKRAAKELEQLLSDSPPWYLSSVLWFKRDLHV